MNTNVWLVIPCFNEEEVILDTAEKLLKKMHNMIEKGIMAEESKILFVDDGSRDNTWKLIKQLVGNDEHYVGIKLAHNRGHQNALLAGMMEAKKRCECIISLDADLQDDIDVFEQFVEKYREGAQIVYGVRSHREKDTFFKRKTAEAYYGLMNKMGADIIYNHADYRLMSKEALNALEEYSEVNLFLRGVVRQLGFKTEIVYYERKERLAGETKYPLKKMISFALEGITSFTNKPLRYISYLGLFFSLVSIGGLAYALGAYFFGYTVQGWTTIVASIWLLGGLQLLGIGVVGEYIGKIYLEVKHRPRYYIEEYLEKDKQ